MNPLTIVIIIVVIVLMFYLLSYILADPYTLQQMQNGQTTSTIEASSLASSSTSAESANFAYSIWFYINDWNYRYGENKVIFGRMGGQSTNNSGTTGATGAGAAGATGAGAAGATGAGAAGTAGTGAISGVDPCPSVVLDATENNLIISMACFPGEGSSSTSGNLTSVVQTCNVSNIAIQRWVNLTISVYGRSMDVYIDGKLVKTCLLPGVANINNSANIYVTPMGGFSGWTSKFQYYPNPLNPQEAWNIYTNGFSSWYSNMFSSYNVQISLVENGKTKSSLTL